MRLCLDCAPESGDATGNCPSAIARVMGAAGGPGSNAALAAKNPGPLYSGVKHDQLGITLRNGQPADPTPCSPLPVKAFEPGEPQRTSPARVRAGAPHLDTDLPAGSRTF